MSIVKFLATKANLIAAEYNGFDRTELTLAELKFAELIVQECAAIADISQFQSRNYPVSIEIENHFGLPK
jgi:hypothetical protein